MDVEAVILRPRSDATTQATCLGVNAFAIAAARLSALPLHGRLRRQHAGMFCVAVVSPPPP